MRTTIRLAAVILLLAACDKKKPTEPTYNTGSIKALPTADSTTARAILPG